MIKTLTVSSAFWKQVFTHLIRENGVSERLVLRNGDLTAVINCMCVCCKLCKFLLGMCAYVCASVLCCVCVRVCFYFIVLFCILISICSFIIFLCVRAYVCMCALRALLLVFHRFYIF